LVVFAHCDRWHDQDMRHQPVIRAAVGRRCQPKLGTSIGSIAVAFAIAVLLLGHLAAPAGAQIVEGSATTESIEAPLVSAGVRDSVVRLYGAVFGRGPDSDGLDYWVVRYVDGTSLARIAQSFIASDEWLTTYGQVDDQEFLDLLYGNVLDRVPDPDGGAYWLGRLGSGLSRHAALLGFSESPEYIAATGPALPDAPAAPLPDFPAAPAGSGQGRRVIYSGSQQRVWWVEADERVVQSYLVSGRVNTPLPGSYRVYSKSPVAWAGHDGITMRHMVRFARGRTLAIGFHSIPRYSNGRPMQTEEQLGTYRSSGCVRQADDMAEALFEWAEIGTTVIVTR
jgi:hypothetical protein